MSNPEFPVTFRRLAVFLTVLSHLTGTAGAQDEPVPVSRPVRELMAPRAAPPPSAPDPDAAPKPKTPTVGRELIRNVNPVTLGRNVRAGYQNREFLSTHGTVHPSRGEAMAHSIAPLERGANVRGAVRATLRPQYLALDLGFPLASELVRQVMRDGRIDVGRLGETIQPVAFAGTLAGSVGGHVLGSAVQSTLAGAFGPVGAVAGFAARPMFAWTGALLGGRLAHNASQGNLSLGDAFRDSIASIEPGRDIGSLVGGTAGMVIGQALIPIPGVGGFVGGMAGSIIGGWIGSGFTSGKDPNSLARGALRGLVGKTPGRSVPTIGTGQPTGYSPAAGLSASSGAPPAAPAAASSGN